MFQLIAEELSIRPNQVKNTVELLDDDNTVPFISRYRKEVTGSLDEEQIRAIEDRIKYLRTLEERKKTVLKSIADQEKLTPELEARIIQAQKLQDVEDLYRPYKPKRRTRATIARGKGLEPLAETIYAQEQITGDVEEIAAAYINEEKGVTSVKEALAGARDIIAEMISDNADIRKIIRETSIANGMLASEAADEQVAARDYEMYMEFKEAVKSVPPYRILAINRGEKEEALYAWIEVDEEKMVGLIEKHIITNTQSIFIEELKIAAADAYQRLISPAIQRELRRTLTDKADEHAIDVFARNLRALLMQPPLKDKFILGIDPGYRSGCKVAAIDITGKYLEGETIYPHPPQKQWDRSKAVIHKFIKKYNMDIIAIGNGTASRETEQLAAEILTETENDLYYTIVNEAGASVYSASPVARKEFPDLDASMRGNISIARRLLDPLSELVKIDPQSIGVGLYQHDVDQNNLSESLDHVVESCVNAVGVDLNTASASLLKYVAGINNRVAENIVKYREEHGRFVNRDQLKAVKGLGANSYTQSAGFLRISDSENLFDSTGVHPESYDAANSLLHHLDLNVDTVRDNGAMIKLKLKTANETMDQLSTIVGSGRETLEDIIDALEKPGRDPRADMPAPMLRSDVLSMNDLYEGMVLKGTVRNVVDFGAFVDIGVKQDGLVHLSQMAKRFVKNPMDVVSVGDVIDVKIMKVDKERGRIGLSMIVD
ncbi:RNA-binding transcriptional accessory protein [bacterium]|nr:RNA-binding transcriptional accessory protein [bacterium]